MTEKKKAEDLCALAYKAYKIDWMRRISADMQIGELINFYDNASFEGGFTDAETDCGYSGFEEWLGEEGYGGALYVCMSEFLDEEFRDAEYMAELLRFNDRPDLRKTYEETLAFIKDNDILMNVI